MKLLAQSFIVSAAFVLASAIASAQDRRAPEPPTLTVTGSAQLSVQADEVRFALAVETESAQAGGAVDQNSKRTERVMSALKRLGLTEDEYETGGFSVRPRYTYDRSGAKPPTIAGFTVTNQVRVKTKRIELAGEAIAKGVEAGANRVAYVTFALSDPRAHRAEAIAEATANARADAMALASAAGVRIVRTLKVDLDAPVARPLGGAGQQLQMARAAGESVAAPPLEAGDVNVTASVRIVYEIE